MRFSPLLAQLIESLKCLPGVGSKTAQRMAFHLLARGRDQGKQLGNTLLLAMGQIQHCHACRLFSENPICDICNNAARDQTTLCVVESAVDVLMVEQTGLFKGRYFVLLGRLSPLDGVGPNDIGIPLLQKRLAENTIQELILATNPTVEGEATAHYLSELAKTYKIKVTRIAHGVPIGSELEFIDSSTLAHALLGRSVVS